MEEKVIEVCLEGLLGLGQMKGMEPSHQGKENEVSEARSQVTHVGDNEQSLAKAVFVLTSLRIGRQTDRLADGRGPGKREWKDQTEVPNADPESELHIYSSGLKTSAMGCLNFPSLYLVIVLGCLFPLFIFGYLPIDDILQTGRVHAAERHLIFAYLKNS